MRRFSAEGGECSAGPKRGREWDSGEMPIYKGPETKGNI